ncbi:Uncharacterised protein [Mycobacteroides abscessus subsp. abscessus]|nr:Uncharacterised protein [Mycobacteroides abscessus subsp. abscessus]
MLADLRNGQRTVRPIAGIADIQDVLVGQLIDDGARHRQTTDAGIENSDGCIAHGVNLGGTPGPRAACTLRSLPESQ